MICMLGNRLKSLIGLPVVVLDVVYFSIDDVDRTSFRNQCRQDGSDKKNQYGSMLFSLCVNR